MRVATLVLSHLLSPEHQQASNKYQEAKGGANPDNPSLSGAGSSQVGKWACRCSSPGWFPTWGPQTPRLEVIPSTCVRWAVTPRLRSCTPGSVGSTGLTRTSQRRSHLAIFAGDLRTKARAVSFPGRSSLHWTQLIFSSRERGSARDLQREGGGGSIHPRTGSTRGQRGPPVCGTELGVRTWPWDPGRECLL